MTDNAVAVHEAPVAACKCMGDLHQRS